MPDERDELDLEGLDSLDELDNPSDPDGGSKNNPPSPGVYKALRHLNKQVKAVSEAVAKLAPKPSEPPSPPIPAPTIPQDNVEERVELRMQGYSVEEIDFIKRNQKPGQSLLEAAKDPYVVAAVEKTRENKKVADATPAPSNVNGIPVPEGKKMKDVAESRSESAALQEQLIAESRRKRNR